MYCRGLSGKEQLLTMDVADHRLGEAVPGECHEHFSSTLPPQGIMLGAPRRDGREKKRQVVLPSKLLCWGCVGAQLHQHLAMVSWLVSWLVY